jgi:DNA primase
MFDIVTLLEKYATIVSGPSSKGEVFLAECPYCGKPSTHRTSFSVNIEKYIWHCFRCGRGGPLTSLISFYAKIPYEAAEDMLEQPLGLRREVKKPEEPLKECEIPPQSFFTIRANRYLEERGIDSRTQIEFGLYYCNQGRYQGRIIIPVFFNGKIITFQARTVMPDEEIRYLSPFNAPKSRIWFNLDSYINQDVYIVEGMFDCMKLWQEGIFAIAPLGKEISNDQMNILLDKRIKRVYLLQDQDALPELQKRWEKLSKCFEVRIKPIIFKGEDPASMTSEQLEVVMNGNFESAYDVRREMFNHWREEKL